MLHVKLARSWKQRLRLKLKTAMFAIRNQVAGTHVGRCGALAGEGSQYQGLGGSTIDSEFDTLASVSYSKLPARIPCEVG